MAETSTLHEFFKKLPKLELHAHLNGSLSEATMNKLSKLKQEESKEQQSDLTAFCDLSSCFEIFGIAHNLTDTTEAVKLATALTIQEFSEDGVVYLELRSTPRREEKMTKRQYLMSLVEGIQVEVDKSAAIVTLLVSINRSLGLKDAVENIDLAVELSKSHSDIVVGVDFSGDPTQGRFSDYIPELQRAREHGLKIAVHCAEVRNDEEVQEILDFVPDRVGHVTCLSPALSLALKRLKIPVELCLSSNVKCGTVLDYNSHQFQDFYDSSHGHPIILATDDKGVFDTSLSQEYEIALTTFHLPAVFFWEMNFKAIGFTFAPESTKAKLRKILQDYKDSSESCSLKQ